MQPSALVTGASRGIGKAISYALAAKGCNLFLICKNNLSILEEMKAELESKYSVSVTCFQGDVADESFISSVFSNIDDLDILVNNAGIAHIGLLSDMSLEEWQSVINTNLTSAFLTSRLAIPMMVKKQSGNIINISSVWGKVGASMEVAYSASKGGLNSFTKALAKELAPSKICVNAIACGVIDTDMNACFNIEEMQSLIDEIPADRIGKTDEVAAMVTQLIDAPTYLTGQIITLDGGWQ